MPRPDAVVFTYEDYLGFPDDGLRHEILDGEHVMTPSPIPDHQFIVGRFLHYFALQARGGVAYGAPLDVILAATTLVQPDVCYLGEAKLPLVTPRGIVGPPDVAIEVLSPGTSRRDQVTKRNLYARYGIGEYWMVDSRAASVRICTGSESGFPPEADRLLTGSEHISSPLVPGLDLPVHELFWGTATRRR